MSSAPSTTSQERPVLNAVPDVSAVAERRESDPRTPSTRRIPRRHRLADTARRGFDILVSATAMLVLMPVFAVTALLVKVSSPGPILYSQIRVGLNRRRGQRRSTRATGPADRRGSDRRSATAHGRPFRIWKFRTMVVDAEEYGPQWSSKRDPRITPIGRFLRLTRLDETPQFWNVLKGDMSLIGPRPERPYFVEQFAEEIPDYPHRLTVRPGITGQAQVTLDYDSSLDDVKKKLAADLDYVEKRSLKRDFGILLKTVGVVFTGKGAC